MSRRLWTTAIDRATRLVASSALDEATDLELLARFLADRNDLAFGTLVRRHGPLVWGVCRNLLPSEADAEDAFQATFLALVRGANRIRRPAALGAWLHSVAGRVCRNSLRSLARRRKHERSAAIGEADTTLAESTWDRWQHAVHAEVAGLPEQLRTVFVLCVLEGVRQPDAARQLGWKLGTVSGRVAKAKQRLAERLEKRGLSGAAGLAAVLGSGATAGPISASLVTKGLAVREGGASTIIHELARGASGGLMGTTKFLAATLVVAGLGIGFGTKVFSPAEAQMAGGSQGGPTAELPYPPAIAPKAGPGMMSGGMSMGRAPVAKVEYKFMATPGAADAFKKMLVQLGADGWEYVGVVPGDTESIFKRVAPTTVSGQMMGGMAPPAMIAGAGPLPLRKGSEPIGPPAGFTPPPDKSPDVSAPRGGVGSEPFIGSGGGASGVGALGGGPSPFPMAATGPTPPAQVLDFKKGESRRLTMATRATVDRMWSESSDVVDVSADPTDARRVLIRALKAGSSNVELTDQNGNVEKHSIRVR